MVRVGDGEGRKATRAGGGAPVWRDGLKDLQSLCSVRLERSGPVGY